MPATLSIPAAKPDLHLVGELVEPLRLLVDQPREPCGDLTIARDGAPLCDKLAQLDDELIELGRRFDERRHSGIRNGEELRGPTACRTALSQFGCLTAGGFVRSTGAGGLGGEANFRAVGTIGDAGLSLAVRSPRSPATTGNTAKICCNEQPELLMKSKTWPSRESRAIHSFGVLIVLLLFRRFGERQFVGDARRLRAQASKPLPLSHGRGKFWPFDVSCEIAIVEWIVDVRDRIEPAAPDDLVKNSGERQHGHQLGGYLLGGLSQAMADRIKLAFDGRSRSAMRAMGLYRMGLDLLCGSEELGDSRIDAHLRRSDGLLTLGRLADVVGGDWQRRLLGQRLQLEALVAHDTFGLLAAAPRFTEGDERLIELLE
jgi:hypothetical protein